MGKLLPHKTKASKGPSLTTRCFLRDSHLKAKILEQRQLLDHVKDDLSRCWKLEKQVPKRAPALRGKISSSNLVTDGLHAIQICVECHTETLNRLDKKTRH